MLATAAVGCAVKVSTTYDKTADFSSYKSYCWLQGCEFTFTGPKYLNNERIMDIVRSGIVSEMEKKGFVYNEETPDLLVDFHVTVENKETLVYRFEESRFIQLDPLLDTDVYYYLEGTIVMDLVERESGRMVWRSKARRYLELNPELTEENLHKGIAIAMKDFPPKKAPAQE